VFGTAARELFPGLHAHCKRTVRIAALKSPGAHNSHRCPEARGFVADLAKGLSAASRP
jgi:hypothetical protein